MNVAIRDVLRVPKVPPGEYVVGFRWDCETSSREHSSLVFRLFNPGLTLHRDGPCFRTLSIGLFFGRPIVRLQSTD